MSAYDRSPHAELAVAQRTIADQERHIGRLEARGGHWYVPDESGQYCAACALPERNQRHVPRGDDASLR